MGCRKGILKVKPVRRERAGKGKPKAAKRPRSTFVRCSFSPTEGLHKNFAAVSLASEAMLRSPCLG